MIETVLVVAAIMICIAGMVASNMLLLIMSAVITLFAILISNSRHFF